MKMRPNEFIDGVYQAVYRTAINGVMKIVKQPPGRRPRADLTALSEWFNALDEIGQERVHELVRLSVDQAVFGVLATIDGARALPGGADVRLIEGENDLGAERNLHDLFRSRVDHELGYD